LKHIKRSRSQLTGIQVGLAEVLGADQLKQLADIGHLRRDWAKVVGAVLAQHSEPLNLDNGCLHIAVDHPAMAQQIRFLQDEIREACFRQCRVKSIRSIRSRHQPGAGYKPGEIVKVQARRLDLSEKKMIARDIQSVSDKTLRRAMFDARVKQLSFSPWD